MGTFVPPQRQPLREGTLEGKCRVKDMDSTSQNGLQPADEAIALLQGCYDAVLVENTRRHTSRERALEAVEASEMPALAGVVRTGMPLLFNNQAIGTVLLDLMLSDEGRRLIGLDPRVAIAQREFQRRFVDVLEPSGAAEALLRKSRFRMCVDPDDDPGCSNPSRMDIASLVRELRELYGGDRGRRLALAQLADAVFSDLGLERRQFEVKAGKVTLTVPVYGVASMQHAYGRDIEAALLRLARVVSHIEQQRGAADGEDVVRQMDVQQGHVMPGLRLGLGPRAYVKTMKSHYQVVMACDLADELRAFMAEHRSVAQP